MLTEYIERFIDLAHLKEDFRKTGVNFITAGVVGVFINHFVGFKLSTMFWASIWITSAGVVLTLLGLIKIR